jgi:predicted flap endonuclease-1-like 5' DNA nuclease
MVRKERKQKMKLQGSQASSANTLQNQSEVFAKNRFTINGLTVVHGRLETELAPNTPCHRSSKCAEAELDAKRRELGVADELKKIPGITAPMLVAFGEQGIKSIENLANCASDDLFGWIEEEAGKVTRHKGILHFSGSRVANVTP